MTAQFLTSKPRPRGSDAPNLPTPNSAPNGLTPKDLKTSSFDAALNRDLRVAKPRAYDFGYCAELIAFAITGLSVPSSYVLAVWSLTSNIGLTKSFPWSTGPLSNTLIWLAFAALNNLLAARVQRTEHSSIENWTRSTEVKGATGCENGATGLLGNCQKLNSQSAITPKPRRLTPNDIGCSGRSDLEPLWSRFISRASFFVGLTLLAVSFSVTARASDSSDSVAVGRPALAFARYLAALTQRSAFTESAASAVDIDAWLPHLRKQASLSAIRQTGASERSEYQVLHIEGDSMVKLEVIARYLSAQAEAEAIPLSSTLVAPVNYKFHYVGSTHRMGMLLYVFQISPRKKRVGLIQGMLCVDPVTGVAVYQTGRFVKTSSLLVRRINVTRETSLRDGLPYIRVTHAVVYTRLPVGRAELTITERPLTVDNREAVSQVTGESGKP